MYNNDYMYAIERNGEYLAHYGIRGMKWGVRKAREMGGARGAKRLGRQYAKAQKKLAKLEKRAASGKKYARRAALLGAGAAVAGGMTAPGTGSIMNKLAGRYGNVAGKYASHVTGGNAYAQKMASDMARGKAKTLADNISKWGNSNSIANKAAGAYGNAAGKYASHVTGGNAYAQKMASDMARGNAKKAIGGISNKTIARAGAAAVGAGLLGAAGYNAYRAATTKRAARKAQQFRSEMNKAFAGTKYANGGNRQGGKKRRRR